MEDLIAIPSFACVVRGTAMSKEDEKDYLEFLVEGETPPDPRTMPPGLYEEMLSIGGMDPVHWISKKKPENPPRCLTWYPDFDKARSGLRYFLLKAYPNERKKDVDFSRRLALCLYIRREFWTAGTGCVSWISPRGRGAAGERSSAASMH